MKYKILSLIIFFICLQYSSLPAQSDQYQFTRITNNQGLSHNQVTAILKDSKGYMWFGTMSGLNRYDGYQFKIFRHDLKDSASISDNFIIKLFEDPLGNIWVDTRSGINIYDPAIESFTSTPGTVLAKLSVSDPSVTNIKKDMEGNYWFIRLNSGLYKYIPAAKKAIEVGYIPGDTTSLVTSVVADIGIAAKSIWLIHADGILEQLDSRTRKIIYRDYFLQKKYAGKALNYRIYTDGEGDSWIFTESDPRGIFYFNASQKSFRHIHTSSPQVQLNNDLVRGIIQDQKGLLWIGTDHGGVNLLDKKNLSIRYLYNKADDEKSLSQNSINTIYKDNSDIIWLGTYKKGISYYHENIIKFQLFQHHLSDPASLSYNDINRFVEDEAGNLWIGANGGGLIYYNRATGKFTQYLHNPADPNSLSSNVIVSLCIDHEQKLWIGTYYGGLNRFENGKFIHYKHNAADSTSLADDRVWEIFEDLQKNLWIGTLGGGLDQFDRKTNTFTHYNSTKPNSIHSDYISSLMEDREGNLWVGTGFGIDFFDKQTGRFTHVLRDANNPNTLSNNTVTAIHEDNRGMIWVGTREGLNLYNKQQKTFRAFRQQDGLPDNTILTIIEDDNHNIWVSTPNGLSNVMVGKKADSYTYTFKNYDESDGLQGKEFNEDAAFKTRRGELVFGGSNGFNLFTPDVIKVNKLIPEIVFTDFEIFNKSIGVGEKVNGRIILQKSIANTREIVLPYNENVFAIEFAALSFFHPEDNKYKYRLEGFNKDWVTTDGKLRKITYTNLDPGQYTFQVKASNNDGIWNEAGISLNITILPPFWKTHTAFGLYVLLILGALYLSRRLILARARLKFSIEQERQEARRMHELDMMKIRFFTNVSHEFRTPLTLILTPLDKLIKHSQDIDQKHQLTLIHRNAKRLLNLVNQLLDFRKMEVQDIKLVSVPGDMVGFIRDISFSFSDISEKKHIRFSFVSHISELNTLFDPDKLEKILFNLLSNAFKFTPEGGNVSVEVNLQHSDNDTEWLEIQVKDTGIGIPAEKQEKIFERFFQHEIPVSMVNQGSGIGLSITREFVKLHGGSIRVESEPENGSCFVVLLPVKKVQEPLALQNEAAGEAEALLTLEQAISDSQPEDKHIHKKPSVLLIEDNEDFRFYLKDNLRMQYTITEASNGKEGWQQALQVVPDLIVSDVMMPEMDGIELCRKIKSDQRTSHIPVILLTARAAQEQQIEGFKTGANDYITKPFNFELLQSRIKNLIAQRELMQKSFQKKLEINPSEITVSSLDEKLIQKALAIVEKNISNPDFSVEELSRELAISRVYLYKKLLSLTGKSPIEFIRTVRLKRAAQLMEKSQLTVSEIAYQVGFNNPKYFTKYFKMEFNMIPSLYMSEKKKAVS